MIYCKILKYFIKKIHFYYLISIKLLFLTQLYKYLEHIKTK